MYVPSSAAAFCVFISIQLVHVVTGATTGSVVHQNTQSQNVDEPNTHHSHDTVVFVVSGISTLNLLAVIIPLFILLFVKSKHIV
ncbi:hypothetical protein HOG21_04420 [bacterium]|nr:hypothetical protein [bacterium]